MPEPASDRNLLFGILALQMDFIRRDDLIAAMHAWVLDKDQPLGLILSARGALSSARRNLIESLVEEHLKQHSDDPQESLAAITVSPAVRQELATVSDANLQATLWSLSATAAKGDTGEAPPVAADGTRYRKLRPHARGGLGEVFVAEDAELHREVALKEIQEKHADDPASRNRFLLEAEITGGLEHPGIVPVYGLGTYADGRPYYAMRFIRGQSLKEALADFHTADKPGRDPSERSLAFRQLLRRFVDVCNAVGYAHSRGVLHRDLKPANVLLGPFGETLVVDWGLAKAGVRPRSDADEHEHTTDPTLRPAAGGDQCATRTGDIMGTPIYMSPEQAAGRLDEVGPATDIYGLGATLFVLLTGHKPFEDAAPSTVLERVRRGEWQPPQRLKANTPAPLDAICRKAMALRPTDRYATALDLAADVEHWLADEPVRAYRVPWTVRLGRQARRHRTAVVAAAVFLASAVVSLSVSTVLIWREQRATAAQKQRAEEQQRLAEDNYNLARDLSFQSIVLIESSEAELAAAPSFQAVRKDILTTAARAFRRYLEQQPNDPELRRRTAEVYRYTAHFHNLANETEAAEPLYKDSIHLQKELIDQFPAESVHRDQLAGTLRDYSQMQAGAGRLREATDTLHQAVAVAEKLRADDPERPAYRRTLAIALLDQSGVEHARGLVEESNRSARTVGRIVPRSAGCAARAGPSVRSAPSRRGSESSGGGRA